eukprot:8137975-Pyramimonas_sp.AAC.1
MSSLKTRKWLRYRFSSTSACFVCVMQGERPKWMVGASMWMVGAPRWMLGAPRWMLGALKEERLERAA